MSGFPSRSNATNFERLNKKRQKIEEEEKRWWWRMRRRE